jgi:hypothetical protein
MKPPKLENLAGDFWGGFAAMLVALPSAIAFGVTIYASLGGSYAASARWPASSAPRRWDWWRPLRWAAPTA